MSIIQYVSNAYLDNWIKHFWEKVEKTQGCWLWKGATNQHGYGRVVVLHDGYVFLAHRVSYELCTGNNLDKKTILMHTCDIPNCVNPKHLIPGTQAENIQDCIKKNRRNDYKRGHLGIKNPSHKLQEQQVINILKDREKNMSYSKLIDKYNISKSQIARICKGKSWRNIYNSFKI